MKSNLAKKIVSITVIALVVALVITTIVLALVPKKMADPIASGYSRIFIYQDNNSAAVSANVRSDVFEEIQDLHEASLKDNVLSAIFQGTGSFNSTVKKEYKSNVLTSIAGATGNALVFEYLQTQTLKINGEVYKDESTLSSSTVEFDMIIMPLTNGTNFEECTIYLVDSSENTSSYQVNFLACQAELNDYISSVDFGMGN